MKYTKQLLTTILIVISAQACTWAQCNTERTIAVCDMETIDFDTDGNPDGIINLYTETGTTPADGIWSADPRYAITLDETTGNVRTWEFQNATETDTIDEYTFQLFNSTTCGTNPVQTVNLILGPYSGVALPPGPNDANIEICSSDNLDLYEVLTSDQNIPAPHLNGEWEFVSNDSGPLFEGSFSLSESLFSATIPYDAGPPTVDSEIFTLRYTVPGIAPCNVDKVTEVKVSVVRQVSAGVPKITRICESLILNGDYDTDINLRDDMYLENEDIEGFWIPELDDTGQISDEQDSFVNIKQIYDDLTNNGTNPRFGCQTYSFSYTVPQRSAVCQDRTSIVPFVIYEQLRPFQQNNNDSGFCVNQIPSTINLFDLLEFSNIDGFDFIYNNDYYVNWRLVSGDSDLGLLKQPDVLQSFDPSIDYHLGTINLAGATPGVYTFEFGVAPEIVCPQPQQIIDPFVIDPSDSTISEGPCEILSTTVTIEIFAIEYAGETTEGLELCTTDTQVDLRSLLNSSGAVISENGVWTNDAGDVVDAIFVFPEVVNGTEFRFTYTVTTSDNCVTSADLSFTLFNPSNAGEGVELELCSDNLTVTLFDQLSGNPDPTGTWTGPFGYQSTDHLGVFDATNTMLPILGAGVYTYSVPGNGGCNDIDESSVTITIIDPIEIGQDVNETFCILDGRVNLFSLLDRETVRIGVFEDIENTGALTPEGVVEFDLLPNPENLVNPVYNFRYVVPNQAPCDESSLNVAVQVVDLPEPQVPDQQFCILDAKRLDDIEVDVLNYNWYMTLESDTPVVDNPLLFDNDVYYITNVDADNCESERVEVKIDILNTGEKFDNGELCTLDFQDGVSPDGNNQNDSFALFVEDEFNIPVAFPDFELKIYNRYGTQVFEGNANTEEFRGESNTSVRLGDDLPSGTYFYIFTPNFDNNLPIQGSFYLAR